MLTKVRMILKSFVVLKVQKDKIMFNPVIVTMFEISAAELEARQRQRRYMDFVAP